MLDHLDRGKVDGKATDDDDAPYVAVKSWIVFPVRSDFDS